MHATLLAHKIIIVYHRHVTAVERVELEKRNDYRNICSTMSHHATVDSVRKFYRTNNTEAEDQVVGNVAQVA
jgi:hypothetical protein